MLPWQQRLYFWGVHGVFVEVVFTALWDLFASDATDRTLRGFSSLWSFLIFGLGTFLIAEQVYFLMIKKKISLPLRLLVYVLITYIWEFSWGVVLKPFSANSWDYSGFRFNLFGIITLEYAPFWAVSALGFEFIMSLMEQVETIPTWKTIKNK